MDIIEISLAVVLAALEISFDSFIGGGHGGHSAAPALVSSDGRGALYQKLQPGVTDYLV